MEIINSLNLQYATSLKRYFIQDIAIIMLKHNCNITELTAPTVIMKYIANNNDLYSQDL